MAAICSVHGNSDFFPHSLSRQKSLNKSEDQELPVTSVFPTLLKQLLKVAAKSPASVAGPVIAADLQLEGCHEGTALVFRDFGSICNVPWEAQAARGTPGHSLQVSSHSRCQINKI